MKRTLALATALAVVFTIVMMAQGKTDFSGTWKRDAAKSDAPPAMGRGGPGGGGMGGGMAAEDSRMVTQTATELTIAIKRGETSQKLVYKLDGSDSVNPGMRGGDVKAKAKWDGARLVIESTQTMSTPMGEMTMNSKEVWTLGADGTLTIETTRSTPRGDMTTKAVYAKATT